MTDAAQQPTVEAPTKIDVAAKIVFSLAIIFFVTGVALILLHRRLDLEPVWVLLIVPFSLGMTGALILFHFLSSSATINREAYKIGGAIAGFMVLFTTFYNLSRQPFLDTSAVAKFVQTPLGKKIAPIADRYHDLLALHNDTIDKVADASLENLRATFEQLSHGTYTIEADELPTYLLPMIKNSKKSFYATQYVLPERFWGQYWAQKYFDENVTAVRDRRVDLTRIFLIELSEGPKQRQLLDDLIKKHIDHGVPIRIIETKEYLKSRTDEDLRDILLVDGQLSGILLLNKGGSFNRVEFSIDKVTIEKRQRNFDRLLASSMSYEDWKRIDPNRQ